MVQSDPDQLAKVQGTASYEGVRWFATMEELLSDESTVMVTLRAAHLHPRRRRFAAEC